MDPRAQRGRARPGLLSDAQAARIRAISSAGSTEAPGAGSAPRGRRPAAEGWGAVEGPHPWGDLLDGLFRPGSKRHRAADRLLSVRRAGREELAVWTGLSGSAISSLIGSLTEAGFTIDRETGPDRRVQFHVRGRRHPGNRPGGVETRPAHATSQPQADRVAVALPDRAGARVRYLKHADGLAVVEVDGHGTIRGRLLGPVIPISLLTGAAVLHRLTLDRGAPDVEIGDSVHRVRLRLDPRDFTPRV